MAYTSYSKNKLPGVNKNRLSISSNSLASLAAQNTSSIALWHIRLGHVTRKVLHSLFPGHRSQISNTMHQCTICPSARQSRLPFPISSSTTFNAFDLIHMDLWGPYKVYTFDGYKSFITVVDDFSRHTWIFLLKLKSDVILVIKYFIAYVKTQFNTSIKNI